MDDRGGAAKLDSSQFQGALARESTPPETVRPPSNRSRHTASSHSHSRSRATKGKLDKFVTMVAERVMSLQPVRNSDVKHELQVLRRRVKKLDKVTKVREVAVSKFL